MVYILEFNTPLGTLRHQARYYIGYCDEGRLEDRLAEHRAGCGAAITRAANQRGIAYQVIHTLPGGRDLERRLKRHKKTREVVDRIERGTLRL